MKTQMDKWKADMKIESVFKSLYGFAFEYLKPDKATALGIAPWLVILFPISSLRLSPCREDGGHHGMEDARN